MRSNSPNLCTSKSGSRAARSMNEARTLGVAGTMSLMSCGPKCETRLIVAEREAGDDLAGPQRPGDGDFIRRVTNERFGQQRCVDLFQIPVIAERGGVERALQLLDLQGLDHPQDDAPGPLGAFLQPCRAFGGFVSQQLVGNDMFGEAIQQLQSVCL